MLKLNCEDVEDEAIYSAQNVFGNKLKLIAGSLKEIKELKGKAASKPHEFMYQKELPFVQFSSGLDTWLNANKAILKIIVTTYTEEAS